jgi:hypothetical protein
MSRVKRNIVSKGSGAAMSAVPPKDQSIIAMTLKKLLTLRIWNRMTRAQQRIQKLLIQKADDLGMCLLTVDMMAVLRDQEKFAIAKIIPEIRPMVGRIYDYALLYLDLPKAGIQPGFYRLQLAQGREESILPIGVLADENDQVLRNVRYYEIDPFAAIGAAKRPSEKRLTVFETFNVTRESYLIGGTHANGKPFVIQIS